MPDDTPGMSTTNLTPNQQLEQAVFLANLYHAGQVDKCGMPYILHPLRVMQAVFSYSIYIQCVAVLHDVVEDTHATLSSFHGLFPQFVIDAIDAMSRRDGETYSHYIERLKENKMARIVKLHDVQDNMRTDRVYEPVAEWQSMQKRYDKTLNELSKIP